MTDLITEARELCKYSEKIVNQLHTERLDYELEYMPLIETIQVTSELCDALEKAEERGQGCEHCQGWDTRSGAQYCPMCGKKLPVYAGTIGGEMVRHALKELGAEERKVQSMNEIEKAISEIIGTNYGECQCHRETMVQAVEALREKQARESGCEYCINCPEKITAKKERYSHATETGIAYDNIKVNFCPNCGTKMEGKPCG
jgi:hypothetical protein